MAKYNFDVRTVAPYDLWTAVAKEMKARGLTATRLAESVHPSGVQEKSGSRGSSLLGHLRNPTAFAPTSYMARYVDWLNSLTPMAVDTIGDEAQVMAAQAMAKTEEQSITAIADGIYRELKAIRRIMQDQVASES